MRPGESGGGQLPFGRGGGQKWPPSNPGAEWSLSARVTGSTGTSSGVAEWQAWASHVTKLPSGPRRRKLLRSVKISRYSRTHSDWQRWLGGSPCSRNQPFFAGDLQPQMMSERGKYRMIGETTILRSSRAVLIKSGPEIPSLLKSTIPPLQCEHQSPRRERHLGEVSGGGGKET